MNNSIEQILERLRDVPGLKGAAVVTSDGIMVKSALTDSVPEDVISGLISFLLSTARRSLDEGGLLAFRRFSMHCTHGKVVLWDLGTSCLVAVADQFTSLDDCMPRLEETVIALKQALQIQV